METSIPAPARPLGLAGLIPFAGLAIGVWAGWPGAGFALAAYGATILAFLGAVHWGLALRAPVAERGADWPRLAFGVLPALLGWVALLLPLPAGLALLGLGILGTAAVETLAAQRGFVPSDYLRLRQLLSLGAGAFLFLGLLGL